jgi:hypothetical protein
MFSLFVLALVMLSKYGILFLAVSRVPLARINLHRARLCLNIRPKLVNNIRLALRRLQTHIIMDSGLESRH